MNFCKFFYNIQVALEITHRRFIYRIYYNSNFFSTFKNLFFRKNISGYVAFLINRNKANIEF